nr:hypothetical protein [Tanacetum cinerariifolium]
LELPQTSVPDPDEATSKEMQGSLERAPTTYMKILYKIGTSQMVISDEELNLEDASKQGRNETWDDENLDMSVGFGDDVIDTGPDLGLKDDKCTDDIVMEEVSAGGEIPSVVEEQVNTASADITDIRVVLLHQTSLSMENFTPDVRVEISVLLLQMMDHYMERYNQTFKCTCERGDLVLRTSCKPYSYGKQYYACPYSKLGTQDRGCGYFMWMDDLRLHISSSGSSTPPSYSPGTSTRPGYYLGSSRSAHNLGKAECSNCKFLAEKIKTLEAKIKILEGALEIERHPEKHTLDSAAILHELYN